MKCIRKNLLKGNSELQTRKTEKSSRWKYIENYENKILMIIRIILDVVYRDEDYEK